MTDRWTLCLSDAWTQRELATILKALEGNFFAYKKEETFLLWRIQIRMKDMKIIFTPLPTLTRPGFLMCHSSLGGGGGGAMSTTDRHHPSTHQE